MTHDQDFLIPTWYKLQRKLVEKRKKKKRCNEILPAQALEPLVTTGRACSESSRSKIPVYEICPWATLQCGARVHPFVAIHAKDLVLS